MREFRIASALLCLGLIGCSGSTDTEDVNARLFAILGNDFTGNSVRIHGLRSVPADGKYPCLNEFEACLTTDPSGITAAVKDLCPSDNTPEGTWSFTFVMYADTTCTEPLANLGCIPVMDEWLHPGHNHNDVVCITRNGDKEFDFCVIDPVTGAGSEACPVCVPVAADTCNPV